MSVGFLRRLVTARLQENDWYEPCKSRGLRTVLWAAGGEIPLADPACLPLWKDATTDLRAWLAVRGVVPVPELFVNAEGVTMTRAGFEYILEKHTRTAAKSCPSLSERTVSPHQLRHSCAITMLQATRDIRKVALLRPSQCCKHS